MGVDITDPETERLAAELAALTGETVDEALAAALRERLERVRAAAAARPRTETEKQKMIESAKAIASRYRASLTGPVPDHGDFLYDERGLPK